MGPMGPMGPWAYGLMGPTGPWTPWALGPMGPLANVPMGVAALSHTLVPWEDLWILKGPWDQWPMGPSFVNLSTCQHVQRALVSPNP